MWPMGLTLAMTLTYEFSRSNVILTIWWPRSCVRIYQIVTGVTSVAGVPSTHLVCFGSCLISLWRAPLAFGDRYNILRGLLFLMQYILKYILFDLMWIYLLVCLYPLNLSPQNLFCDCYEKASRLLSVMKLYRTQFNKVILGTIKLANMWWIYIYIIYCTVTPYLYVISNALLSFLQN